MKLAYWMYAGPAHIGTLRIASSFNNVHAIMHAPLGDDYFNVMKSMLERERNFTPVTASIVDRNVLAQGSQSKVVNNIIRQSTESASDLIILTPTCTSSILQEDLQNFVDQASINLDSEVLLADINHYRFNEIQAADQTLKQITSYYLKTLEKSKIVKTEKPSVNIIGAFNLGFHNSHDMAELRRLFDDLGIEINLIMPEGISVNQLKNLPKAWFNFVPYREIGLLTAEYLKDQFSMPYVDTSPIGVISISQCIREIEKILNHFSPTKFNFEKYIDLQTRFVSQSAWFSRSVDCHNLTNKQAIVFGDATHAAAITRILVQELGIHVSWAGTYCVNDKEWFNKQVEHLVDNVLITDDHTLVGNIIARIQPAAIFGTQMERHIGKRLNIPCAIISAPIHIQNFSLSYRPFVGYEGVNQIADLVYNCFTLGMEDHLLEIFGGHDTKPGVSTSLSNEINLEWSTDALQELKKIPGFVRNRVKRNTEKFAIENNLSYISIDLMYAAKENLTN